MAIIGKHEVKQQKIAVRKHGTGNIGSLATDQLITYVKKHN